MHLQPSWWAVRAYWCTVDPRKNRMTEQETSVGTNQTWQLWPNTAQQKTAGTEAKYGNKLLTASSRKSLRFLSCTLCWHLKAMSARVNASGTRASETIKTQSFMLSPDDWRLTASFRRCCQTVESAVTDGASSWIKMSAPHSRIGQPLTSPRLPRSPALFFDWLWQIWFRSVECSAINNVVKE